MFEAVRFVCTLQYIVGLVLVKLKQPKQRIVFTKSFFKIWQWLARSTYGEKREHHLTMMLQGLNNVLGETGTLLV